MAQGRMLVRRISKNDEIADLVKRVDDDMGPQHGAYAALLYTWCIPHLDVEGRMHGDPRLVRADVFPLLEWISAGDVTEYLRHLAAAGLVVWYRVGNRQFLSFPGFDASQVGLRKDREQPSIIPAPSNDTGVTPEPCRSDAGVATAKLGLIEVKLIEEKGRELPLPLVLASEVVEPPKEKIEGKAVSGVQAETVERWAKDAKLVFAVLNESRMRVIPGSHALKPTYENLSHIADRLESGNSVADCLHVIGVYESEVRSGGDSKWFTQVTPFISKNFTRALGQSVGTAKKKIPEPEFFTGHKFK